MSINLFNIEYRSINLSTLGMKGIISFRFITCPSLFAKFRCYITRCFFVAFLSTWVFRRYGIGMMSRGLLVLYIFDIFLLDLLISFVLTKRSLSDMSSEEVREEIEKQEQVKELKNTKKSIKDLQERNIPEKMDRDFPVPLNKDDNSTVNNIKEEYSTIWKEANSKKEAFEDILENIEKELNELSEETIVNKEESSDRPEKKSKSSDDDLSDGKGKSSLPESSKPKGSLIDDFANPNNEPGDWTGGDD